MQDERGLIEEARNLGGDYFLLKIAAPRISASVRPGNFVMARISPAFDPLLRRPFGVLENRPPYIWLYYQVRGRGTRLLSALRHGDSLDLLGPLGNSFPEMPGKRVLLIAGGRGIVPLFHYAQAYGGRRPLLLLYGGKGRADLQLLDRVKSLTLQGLFVFSEDGSLGQKGMLSDGLEKIVRDERVDVTMSCGPEPMLARLAGMLKGRGLENHASLEALMGCGFGACHGCAVLTAAGAYRKVCDEGPVFPLEEIRWRT